MIEGPPVNYRELTLFENSVKTFDTSHRLSSDEAIAAIRDALTVFAVENQPNLFVIKTKNKINMLRITSLGSACEDQDQSMATTSSEKILMEIQGVFAPS